LFLILKFILCKNKRFQQSKSFSTVALSSYPAKRELGDVLENDLAELFYEISPIRDYTGKEIGALD